MNQKNPTLAVDFGNTRIHIGFCSMNSKKFHVDIAYSAAPWLDHGLQPSFTAILEELLFDHTKEIDLIYTTVNTQEKTEEFLQRITNILTSYVPDLIYKVTNITEAEIFSYVLITGNFERDRLGADRALKFLFAAQRAQKIKENVLIFSFGTAVTCEGVSATSHLIENYIFPGIQMSFNAIHRDTALVPLFQADAEHFFPEDKYWNQEIYVQRGIFLSVAASVCMTAKLHAPCSCYLTGGNAPAVKNIITKMMPDLRIEVLPFLETNILIDNKENLLSSTPKVLNKTLTTSSESDVFHTMLKPRKKKLTTPVLIKQTVF